MKKAPQQGILWLALLVLIMLTPLGLLAEGTAWGEWSVDQLQGLLGYVPAGLAARAEWWQAPMPDYTIAGHLLPSSVSYIVTALLGAVATYGAVVGGTRVLHVLTERRRPR